MSQPAAATSSDPTTMLACAFRDAIATVAGEAYGDVDPLIRSSQNPEFGDFQANVAMSLGKRLGTDPVKLAGRIAEAAAAPLAAIAEAPEVAGPGFINIRLKLDALARLLAEMDNPSLGVVPDDDPHPIVIDLCSPNVAKQMHVGHLRSTIIGDALARVLERRGRTVSRENHLGDWGLPIAMVLHELRSSARDLDALDLPDLDTAYREAQIACTADERGLAAARRVAGPHRIIELEEQNAGAAEALEGAKATLVRLQQRDSEIERDWQKLIEVTMRAVYEVFDLLNVKLGPEHNRGESSYRSRLPNVVDAFMRAGVAEEDEGAIVVRFEDRERPLLIRKSDGGFLYATTDLAGVQRRVHELGADRLIYVVDARQRDHFRDVFDAARKIGWDVTPDGTAAELLHVGFGTVLGPDRRPLKTRSGQSITLKALLEEAIERATAEVRRRAASPGAPTHALGDEALAAIGRAVGIGAVKYADLSNDLIRDYTFNMDRMIAFDGDTGPYLQYAHARVCSIFAKAGSTADELGESAIVIAAPAERQLALALLRYGSVVADVARTLEPHRLCGYLYDLANTYSTFYEECPVLKAENEALRRSRLRLCDLVRRVLADALDLLGIKAPPRM